MHKKLLAAAGPSSITFAEFRALLLDESLHLDLNDREMHEGTELAVFLENDSLEVTNMLDWIAKNYDIKFKMLEDAFFEGTLRTVKDLLSYINSQRSGRMPVAITG